MKDIDEILENLASDLIERSNHLWPDQGMRAKALGVQKQRLYTLEVNGGKRLKLATLPTLLKIARAVVKEERKRLKGIPKN